MRRRRKMKMRGDNIGHRCIITPRKTKVLKTLNANDTRYFNGTLVGERTAGGGLG